MFLRQRAELLLLPKRTIEKGGGGRFEPIKTSVGEQHLYMFIVLVNDIMIIILLFE